VTNNINTLHASSEQPLASSTGLVAHELAHQWFGDLVTCATWSHMWINEGFASLLPAFWTRENEGQGEFELDRKGTMGSGFSASRNDRGPVVLADYGTDPDRMFRSPSYAGGGARMFMLIDLLGEEVFWRGIRDFLTTYKFKPVTTDQFFSAMSASSGQELDWFKQQWFFSEGAPLLTVTVEGRTARFTQEGAWRLDVPVWQFNAGRWDVRRVRVDGSGGTLQLAGDGPVLIDPERRVMAQVGGAPAFPADQAVAAYRASESAAVRDTLIGLMRELDAESVGQLMAEEKVTTLRQRLAAMIGTGQVDRLLALVDDRDRRIANAAVQRLGGATNDSAVVERLRAVMEEDTNPRIRFTALSSLYRLTSDAALIDRAWNTSAPNEAFKTFALDNWQRTEPDRVRKICLETLRTSTNTILRTDATRRLGNLKDAPGSREVYDALIEIVRDHGSNQPRIAAANALAQYGDKAALEFLRPLANEGNTRFANAVRGPVGRLERAN
jgi:aminopeptidase N